MAILRYPLGTVEIKSLNIKLLYVTYSKFENDWHSLPHSHYFTELCYIINGNGNYLIENQLYPVNTSDIIIINSDVSHTEMSVGDTPLEYIILGIEGLNFSFDRNHEYIIHNCKRDHTEFKFYMQSLLSEMEQKQSDYERICQNLLEVLIVKLVRLLSLSTSTPTPSVKANHACRKIKQFIEQNYAQEITLDKLASVSHLSKYYMVHAFTNCYGCSPMNYLSQVRIKNSMELLESTDYSITQIAQLSGFSSQSYFAQSFQKFCNTTASKYRQEHQNSHNNTAISE